MLCTGYLEGVNIDGIIFWQVDEGSKYSGNVLTVIISYFDRQLLGNKWAFAPCSIHILLFLASFISFGWVLISGTHTPKVGKIQAAQPPLGRPSWHLQIHFHIFGTGAKWHIHNASKLWIEGRFDQMDWKASPRIKGHTCQEELKQTSANHYPGWYSTIEK